MKRVCAWCKKELGTTENGQEKTITHSICEACRDNLLAGKGQSLLEYIDTIDIPIAIVGPDVVIKAVNKATLPIPQKDRCAVNSKGGDVFECAYAKQPEGCGNTIHCSGCAIRLSVTDTYETGKSHRHTPATLHRLSDPGTEDVKLLISTEKVGDVVLLRIDDVAQDEEESKTKTKTTAKS